MLVLLGHEVMAMLLAMLNRACRFLTWLVAPSMLLRLSTKPKVDRPKSVSLMWPSALINRLSGFRSLWIMPCKCPLVRYCNPGCRLTLLALVQIFLPHDSDR